MLRGVAEVSLCLQSVQAQLCARIAAECVACCSRHIVLNVLGPINQQETTLQPTTLCECSKRSTFIGAELLCSSFLCCLSHLAGAFLYTPAMGDAPNQYDMFEYKASSRELFGQGLRGLQGYREFYSLCRECAGLLACCHGLRVTVSQSAPEHIASEPSCPGAVCACFPLVRRSSARVHLLLLLRSTCQVGWHWQALRS